MVSHEKTIRVVKEHLDELNHVNNVQYVHWIQDIAREHWRQLASEEMVKKYIWFVVNHNITYKNAAMLNDEITIRTHVARTEGCFSIRAVKMFNKNTGTIYVHSETKFCLINIENGKPLRIPEHIENLFIE